MDERGCSGRRRFIVGAATAGAALVLGPRAAGRPPAKPKEEAEVSPAEDLMREHGVLERVLLVYEDIAQRLAAAQPFPGDVLPTAAGLVRRFLEDYHGKLEEDFLFPRFEKAGQHVALVATLRAQHQRGRALTDETKRLAAPGAHQKEPDRRRLAEVLLAFSRMYRPHAAREDTVLFPAFRSLVGQKTYAELGEQFEEREHALFGEHGFENIVAEVATLEQALGLHDLAKFTPKG